MEAGKQTAHFLFFFLPTNGTLLGIAGETTKTVKPKKSKQLAQLNRVQLKMCDPFEISVEEVTHFFEENCYWILFTLQF